jgi:O-antigen/teichoic acid export membrane protein
MTVPTGLRERLSRLVALRELKGAALFSSSSVILNLASLAAGFLVYRWLDPYYMGIWQTMMLVQTYCSFLTLGVANGMNRELPYVLGRGEVERGRRMAATTQAFSLWIGVLSLAGFAVAFWLVPDDPDWRMSIAALGLVVPLSFYSQYLQGTFRANADFDRLSVIQYLDAVLRVGSVALVYFFGYAGYCARAVGLVAAVAVLTFAWRPMRVRPSLSLDTLKDLLKTGIPIFAFSYLFGFADSIPRLVLLHEDAVETLGLYAPVLTLLGTMNAFFDSLRAYLYPKVSHYLGSRNDDVRGLWRPTLAIHLLSVASAVPVALAGIWLIPLVVEHFMPRYLGSLEALNVGLVIILFLGYRIGATLLTALKSWRHLALFVGAFLLLQWGLPTLFLAWFPPLLAVSWGQAASAAVMLGVSLLVNRLAMRCHP